MSAHWHAFRCGASCEWRIEQQRFATSIAHVTMTALQTMARAFANFTLFCRDGGNQQGVSSGSAASDPGNELSVAARHHAIR